MSRVLNGKYDEPKWCHSYYSIPPSYLSSIERCGCIFFTNIKGEIYFCFGVDYSTKNELTDFGGGRKIQRHEDIFACAHREALEETECCFGKFDIDYIYNGTFLYNKKMLICFIETEAEEEGKDVRAISRSHFHSKVRDPNRKREILDIYWISQTDLISELGERPQKVKIYGKVRRFLYSAFLGKSQTENLMIKNVEGI